MLGLALLGAYATRSLWLGASSSEPVAVSAVPPIRMARPGAAQQAAPRPNAGGLDQRRAVPVPSPTAGASAAEPTDRMLPRTGLAVVLIGVVTGASPGAAAALIRDLDHKTGVRRVGDAIADGAARIVEIGPQRVVLERAGRREILEVDRSRDASRPPPPTDPRNLTAEELFAMPAAELEARLNGTQQKQLMVDIRQARAGLDALGRFSLDPTSAGIQVQNFEPDSALGRMGLAPGDRIVNVDGVDVRSLDVGMDALAESLYSVGGNTILTLQRADGSRVQIATDSGALLPPALTRDPRSGSDPDPSAAFKPR